MRIHLPKRKLTMVFGTVLPRRLKVQVDATMPVRWIRIGLVPGTGRFRGTTHLFSFLSLILMRSWESRDCHVEPLRWFG